MKEFLCFVRSEGDHLLHLSPEQQQQHVQKIAGYIGDLMKRGILKGAQPLDMAGSMVIGKKGAIKDGPFNESKEVIVGYFHILADDLESAVAIAKENPMFQDVDAKIEVRPIKTMEGINS